MKNPFQAIFNHGPAHCSLVEDVQDALHTKAWWQEKRDAFDQIQIDSEHSDNRSISLRIYSQELLEQPCFGDDETSQMPAPSMDNYRDACQVWEDAIEEFQSTHPALYHVWSLGHDGLEKILEGLEEYANGRDVSPGRWRGSHLSGMYGYFEANPEFEAIAKLSMKASQSLFGDQMEVKSNLAWPGQIDDRSKIAVTGARSGLDSFGSISQAYDQERDRGRTILEDWSNRFSAALSRVEEEHAALRSYLTQAEEKYAEARRTRVEEGLHRVLWGDPEA